MADCSVLGCNRKTAARSWCLPHYKRWRRRGSVEDIKPEARFFARVSQGPDGCWLWDRAAPNGYGQFAEAHDRVRIAHRWAYEFLRAEIPDGAVLDHLCRNKLCVNPWHLEPVTQRVNLLRSNNFMAQQIGRTHCRRGHPFDEANTYITPGGRRNCRTCRHAAWCRYQSRRLVGASLGS